MQTSSDSKKLLERNLSGFLGYLMKAGQEDVMRTIAELDLSISQLRALFVLDAAGSAEDLALGVLAARVGLSTAAMGRAIDRLVHDGYVTRTEDQRDRRVKRLALTDAGRSIARSVMTARREAIGRFVASLEPEEAEALGAAIAPLAGRYGIDHCAPPEEGRR